VLDTIQSNAGGQGLAGFAAMTGLGNSHIRELTEGIDREAQNTLVEQLPEVSAAMQAAGLGRSGANEMKSSGLYRDIMSRANDAKQQTLAQFQEGQLGREASALQQAVGFGAQDEFGRADAMRQGALAGLQGATNIFGQGVQNVYGKNVSDMDRAAQVALGEGNLALQSNLGEAQMGQSGFEQMQGMHGFTNDMDRQRMFDMLGIGEQERIIEQQRLSQEYDTQMMPLKLMLQMATGSPSSPVREVEGANPWANAGAQIGKSAVGNIFGGGGGGSNFPMYDAPYGR
jgi:hypothetical protein